MALVAVLLDAVHGAATRSHAARTLRAALAAIVALAALSATWSGAKVRATNVDVVASRLESLAMPGDVIVLSPWYYGVGFDRAYRGSVPWTSLPPMGDLSIHRYDLLKQAMATSDALRPVRDAITTALSSGHRVFVVGGLTIPAEGEHPQPLPPAPTPHLGWRSGEYLNAWMLELGYVLRSHALDGRALAVEESPKPTNPLENLPLLVFQGYRP
jgi:hypothetical protein